MEIAFWLLASLIATSVIGYGVAIIIAARLSRPEVVQAVAVQADAVPLRATVVIAAHNEEDCIGAKLVNVLGQEVGAHDLSVLVVTDGCSDRTAAVVRTCAGPRVRLIEITEHNGKIPALNQALPRVDADVVIFSDANSRLEPGSLAALLAHFSDRQVGGVCGAPAVARRRSGWLGAAEQLYWRYDNALKLAESRLGGAVSATGSLYAVRRALLGPVPTTVADDFYISTQVVAAGLRLAFEPRAVSVEAVSGQTRREFGRRVRSTERGWRGLLLMRRLLDPRRTGLYAVHLLFHKLLRRLTPFLLLVLLALSAALAPQGGLYAVALALQLAIYGIALAALLWPAARRLPGASLVFFFCQTQVAMALGLIRVALGLHSQRWTPVRETS